MAGKFSVCLVYPNIEKVGVSNLGFQKIYMTLKNTEGVECDLGYLPEEAGTGGKTEGFNRGRTKRLVKPDGIRSSSLKRQLLDFDAIAFSVTFELDGLNVLTILSRAGIPLTQRERGASGRKYPVIFAGGVAVTLNPEPLSRFFDFFILGEGETGGDGGVPAVSAAVLSLRADEGESLDDRLEKLCKVDGVYVPSLYEVSEEKDGSITRKPVGDAPAKVRRLINTSYSRSGMMAMDGFSGSVFSDTVLVEAGKGCGCGCRFCAAGFVYRPVRHVDIEVLKEQATRILSGGRKRIGLVGSAICEHPAIKELYRHIVSAGGELTVSSLRIGLADGETFRLLAEGGMRTVTMAPEAGSHSMRKRINKDITDDEIVAAAAGCAEAGILNIKFYFLIGLPGETDDDVAAIGDIARRSRDAFVRGAKAHGRVGKLTVSVNPFIPKPFTPFEREPFEGVERLKRKATVLKKIFSGERNMALKVENIGECALQAALSTGGRSGGEMYAEAFLMGGWGKFIKSENFDSFRQGGVGKAGNLPWGFIDSGVDGSYLAKERERSLTGKTTPPCPEAHSGCVRCGDFKGVCS